MVQVISTGSVHRQDYSGVYERSEWMTREEAKVEINKVFEPAFANYIVTALMVGSTPSERNTMEWIPIRIKSPQNGQRVFISTIKGMIHDVIWNTDCIHNYARNGCWYRNWFVVAWMPFSLEPYKAKSDDRNEI